MSDYTLYRYDLPDGLSLGPVLSIDCEMMGLNLNRDRLCVVQIFDPQSNHVHIVQFPDAAYDAPNLRRALSTPDTLFLGHMIRLDMGWLYKYLGVMLQNVYCTRTASRIAQTFGASHDFKDLVSNLLGEKIDKSETASYWGAAELTPDQIRYVCNDVLFLPRLKEKLDVLLEREGRAGLFAATMKTLQARTEMDAAGWWGEDILSFPFGS